MFKIAKKVLGVAAVVVLTGFVCSAPANAADRLTVKDSASNVTFNVDDAGTVTAKGLTINDAAGNGIYINPANGRIATGHTNPTVVLHAKGPSSVNTQMIMNFVGTNATGGGGFIAYHSNATGHAVNGDRLGYFLFGSVDPTNGNTKNGGGIVARAEGNFTTTSAPTAFLFETAPVNSTTRTERFRISSAGNIVAGNNAAAATGPLAVAATDGFLYIPTVAGSLTSCASVTQYTGHAPVWFDTTNNKVCTCNGTALKCTAAMN